MKYLISLCVSLLSFHLFADDTAKSNDKNAITIQEKIYECSKIDRPNVVVPIGKYCEINSRTKLKRVEIERNGTKLTGWKVESTELPAEFKEKIFLDYDHKNTNKNLAAIKANCEKYGAKVPSYEELSQLYDVGYNGILRQSFKGLSDSQFWRIRILSSSFGENRRVHARRLRVDKPQDPLVKIPENSSDGDLKSGYLIGFCVLK